MTPEKSIFLARTGINGHLPILAAALLALSCAAASCGGDTGGDNIGVGVDGTAGGDTPNVGNDTAAGGADADAVPTGDGGPGPKDVPDSGPVKTDADSGPIVPPDATDDGQPIQDVEDGEVGGGEEVDAGPDFEIPDIPDMPEIDENCKLEGGPLAGCMCKQNGDCNSGACIDSPKGKICAEPCVSDCPDKEYTCKTVQVGSDNLQICMPKFTTNGGPCANSTECKANQSDAVCVSYGDAGNFCGAKCATNDDCPGGYICADAKDEAGVAVKACQKIGGQTPDCSTYASDAGMKTSCKVTNEFGSCAADRKCTGAGLEPCTAKTPEKEVCDGKDNNCDSTPDNLPADAECEVKNEYGACKGTPICSATGQEICQGKTPKAELCNGEDDNCDGKTDEGFTWKDPVSSAEIEVGAECGTGDCAGGKVICKDFASSTCSSLTKVGAESCDGKDNDCNGITDETICDDKNTCTDDVCADDGLGSFSCKYTPNTAPCTDDNLCTTGDVCKDGKCDAAEINCDDGEQCTDDSCDKATGKCLNKNRDGSCADNNECTKGDVCGDKSGVWTCLAGGPVDCDDKNICTDDSCDPAKGCVYTNNQEVEKCYEGGAGTEGKGLCKGGTKTCADGVLGKCEGQVLPTAEACDGKDNNCDSKTDEGCTPTSVTLTFSSAYISGKSGDKTVQMIVGPSGPVGTASGNGSKYTVNFGFLAWLLALVGG